MKSGKKRDWFQVVVNFVLEGVRNTLCKQKMYLYGFYRSRIISKYNYIYFWMPK